MLTNKHTHTFTHILSRVHCQPLYFLPSLPISPSLPHPPADSCCVEVTVHLVEGPSLSSLPAVLWFCVNVLGFLIRLCTQTGPKAEAAPLCLKLAHSLSPFLLALCLSVFSLSPVCHLVQSVTVSLFLDSSL